MPYCWKCGVELEESARSCPLCSTPVPLSAAAASTGRGGAPPDLDKPVDTLASLRERHPYQLWMIVSAPFVTALLVVLSISLRMPAFPAWAPYALGSVVAGWALASLFLALGRWPLPSLAGMGITSAGLLLFFDSLDGGADWFLPLALPIVAAACLFVLALAFIIRDKEPKGLHSVGFFFIATAVLCLVIDGAVSARISGAFDPRWSLVVGSALLPFALLFILLHYAFKRRIRLRRYFNL